MGYWRELMLVESFNVSGRISELLDCLNVGGRMSELLV